MIDCLEFQDLAKQHYFERKPLIAWAERPRDILVNEWIKNTPVDHADEIRSKAWGECYGEIEFSPLTQGPSFIKAVKNIAESRNTLCNLPLAYIGDRDIKFLRMARYELYMVVQEHLQELVDNSFMLGVDDVYNKRYPI